MRGAGEYKKYLKSGKATHGQLEIDFGQHARGKTLHISIRTEQGCVEVYGVTGGQPGWSESYGWLHKGPWVTDFEKYIESRRLEVEHEERAQMATTEDYARKQRELEAAILSSYKTEAE